VDLDTSDGVYQPLAKVSWGIPVIWARQATFSQRARKFYTAEALGGAGSPNSAGLVELIADSDGAVRRYRRFLQTDCGHLPLLPVALLKAGGMADRRDEDELLVDFYGHTSGRHRDHWWAGDIIKAGTDPDIVREQPLKNKIVLLGVGYRGIDELRTPLGWMNGVEILAHIAETDHLNVAPTTRRVLSLIILAGAFLIALGFATLGTRRAVSAAVAGTGASALLMWFYTSSIRDTLLLVAVLVAVLAQQIYSKVKEFLKREGERVAEKNAQGHRLSCV